MAEQQDPEKNPGQKPGPEKPGPDHDLRITFQDTGGRYSHEAVSSRRNPDHDLRRSLSGATNRSGSRARARSRSRSRASSRDGLPPTSPYSGVQIEYRTLSIHVSESRQAHPEGLEKKHTSVELKDKQLEAGEDYFAGLSYHELSKDQLCQQLNVAEDQGLSDRAASVRLERDGKNVLPHPSPNYFNKVFRYVFGGFCSVLWVGVIVFFLCWKPLSNPPSATNLALAILVLIVITLQATFNAFQDWSTQRTMKSILGLLPAETLVLRNGVLISLPSTELVAGDVVHLTMGNKVPADLRLLNHSGDIRFDRSMLTGESEEVEGAIDGTDPNFLESRNIALMGTMVVNGSGVGVIVLTGHRSVMGRIAQAMGDVKEKPTLIQQEITRFVRIIVCLTVFLALLIALTWALWLRRDHQDFLTVVGMLNNVMGCVVAFIPEGMPIAVSLTLMMIAKRMKATDILPKGLSVVETLGCVNVICSDKTGTLTENLMSVASVAFADRATSTNEAQSSQCVDPPAGEDIPTKAIERLHRAATLCNDASFDPTTANLPIAERRVKGNATDAAVLRVAALVNGDKMDELLKEQKRAFSIPFNSRNKWMLTMFHKDGATTTTGTDRTYEVFVKGAPDVLLPACTKYWSGKSDSVEILDNAARSALQAFQNKLSSDAERVIMLCERQMSPKSTPGTNAFTDEVTGGVLGDNELTIIGILGIIDPPRPEAASTVAECRRAGARFIMVTGDYGLTAAAIARNIGIFTSHDGQQQPDRVCDLAVASSDVIEDMPAQQVGHATAVAKRPRGDLAGSSGESRSLLVEGHEIGRLSTDEWNVVCGYEEIVFARTTPEQKLRIVKEFRERDHVVAVTGDGVNDAPAMRAADVGVAIVTGSDVAIEASDLVLLDRFDSIIEAIRLGRLVFQNLQKVVSYLLPAGSWSEIWPVLVNVFFGVPLPLSSFLMIIICVFTDLFLSLSLIMEKAELDLLSLPPRDPRHDHLINLRIYGQAYLFTGSMETCTAHAMFFLYMWKYAGIPISDLFFLFEGYTDGYHGYTQDQLTHFNSVGQSVYFVTIVILQWGNILAVRNRRMSIVQADPFTRQRRNPWLMAGMLISLVIAIFVTEVPGIQNLFGTAPVPIEFWLIPLPLAVGILVMDELRKLTIRLFPRSIVAKIAW